VVIEVSARIAVVSIVGDRDILHAKLDMGLNDHDRGADDLQRLPHPTIISIDVNRADTDVAGKSSRGYQPIDVFRGDKGLFEERRIETCVWMRRVKGPATCNVARIGVDKQAVPAKIESEISAIRIDPVRSANI
jgi:hypothetical protein